jgi:protein-tyrosine phosphatase
MSDGAFTVVCICTGNRFRSPLAEALLRDRLGRLPASVSSYGTADTPPGPAFPEAIRLGQALGVDLSGHVSRSLAGADLRAADLVVGFEGIHVAKAVVEAGAARDRTFTLPDLAAYLALADIQAQPVEAAREAVRGAAERRADESRPPQEVPDPVGGSDRVYEETALAVAALVAVVANALLPAGA